MIQNAKIARYIHHHLKIKHLKMLVELADQSSVAQAAKNLHVTQPAVSKMLAEMEVGLDLELFERVGRGIKPTAFGELMIRYAREILLNLVKANEEILSLTSGTKGHIRIGILAGLATQTILTAVKNMKAHWPNITIAIREGKHAQNMHDLAMGHLDLLIGRVYINPECEDFEVEIMYEEPLVLVVAKQHPLVHKHPLEWNDLENLPWIMPGEDSPTHQRLLQLLAQHNIKKPKNIIECVARNITIPLLSMPPHIGMLPLSDARQYAQQGIFEILPLSLGELPAPMGMIWNKTSHISEAQILFQDQIRRALGGFVSELTVGRYGMLSNNPKEDQEVS